jgi:DNA-directed RNA polymerase specialized sigma24 family protein
MGKNKTKITRVPPQDSGNEILYLSHEAIKKSLMKRDMYSLDLCEELTSQLVFNIFNMLAQKPITELPNYIRVCAKNLVINHGTKTKNSHEVSTDPSDMVFLEATSDATTLDVMIREEYETFDSYQLGIIRAEIGDHNYLMLEYHFRDGYSYKKIADEMNLEHVHLVANHINRARAKCKKMKEEGLITY